MIDESLEGGKTSVSPCSFVGLRIRVSVVSDVVAGACNVAISFVGRHPEGISEGVSELLRG